MNIIIQKVPATGVKFISDWAEYELPRGHCIVDKGVTGCGYTEYCLRNSLPLVLCSPRKLLLENKLAQHVNDANIIYLQNINSGDFSGYQQMRDRVKFHLQACYNPFSPLPPKIMVTYDSLPRLIQIFGELSIDLGSFRFVVDEFQSVFMDSFFKASTEFNFVEALQGCPDVLYLSATPMLDKYLNKVPEFMNLPYYRLDWSETGCIETVKVTRKKIARSIQGTCAKVIADYKKGNYPIILDSSGKPIYSTEAVFFMNSVSDIVKVIKRAGLDPSEVNIICADDSRNVDRLRKLSRELKCDKDHSFKIGTVPLENETNKMFTFCTKTAYIGADFYSTCAKSFVFADPNIKALATDISQDLPQIVGRQRNRENPFKNEITLFYKLINEREIQKREDFDRIQEERRISTKNLLNVFEKCTEQEKKDYLRKLRSDIDLKNYEFDFVSISMKTGQPVYNTFLDLANERAWEVAQRDYQSSITVTKSLESSKFQISQPELEVDEELLTKFEENINKYTQFTDRLRVYCEFMDSVGGGPYFKLRTLEIVQDSAYQTSYEGLGTSGCRSYGFKRGEIEKVLRDRSKESQLEERLRQTFNVGDEYLKSSIKNILKDIYSDLNITKKPKATDLESYFKLKSSKMINPETGKYENSFKITCSI